MLVGWEAQAGCSAMQRALVLLCAVFLVGCVAKKGPFLEPVTLVVEEEEFVELPTGNPGKYNKYRVDYRLNETYIYSSPQSYSRTYSADSEIFYFQTHKLRLPVRFEVPDKDVSLQVSTVHHHGVLGLGPGSHVWRYWCKATVSSTSIRFGEHDGYIARKDARAVALGKRGHAECFVNGKMYRLRFDLSSERSYFPHELFHQKNFSMEFDAGMATSCARACEAMDIDKELTCTGSVQELVVSMDDYTVVTSAGYAYPMVEINKRDASEIVLGRIYLDKMAVYIDKMRGLTVVKPSFARFNFFGSRDTNVYFSFTLSVIYVAWFLTTGELANVERNRLFFMLLQLYGELVVTSVLLYNAYGIQADRFYTHLLRTHLLWPYWVFMGTLALLVVANVYVVARLFHFSRDPFESAEITASNHPAFHRWTTLELLRRSLFETTLLLGIWLCLMQYHATNWGSWYMIFIATLLNSSHLVLTIMTYIRTSTLIACHILLYTLSTVFLLYCNLYVYMQRYCEGSPYIWEMIVLYAAFVVVMPSAFTVVQVERGRINYHIEKMRYDLVNKK